MFTIRVRKGPILAWRGTGVSIIRAPFWMCKETMSKIPVNYEKNSYCQAISIDRRAHTFSIYTKSPFWLKTAEEGVATRISLSDTPLCETMCCALIYHPVGLFPSSQSKSLRLNSQILVIVLLLFKYVTTAPTFYSTNSNYISRLQDSIPYTVLLQPVSRSKIATKMFRIFETIKNYLGTFEIR